MNWLLVLAAAALILLNAFFVIAEYSLVRSRHSRMELAAEQGQRGARLALRQLENINEYISTCQVGNTAASIGIGAIGEPALAHLFEHALGNAGGHARRGRDRRDRRLPADHRRADHGRRDGAEALRDRPRRARGAAHRAAAAVLPRPLPPVHRRADRDLERDAGRARRRPDAARRRAAARPTSSSG